MALELPGYTHGEDRSPSVFRYWMAFDQELASDSWNAQQAIARSSSHPASSRTCISQAPHA